jgi:ERCC4-type nuclease
VSRKRRTTPGRRDSGLVAVDPRNADACRLMLRARGIAESALDDRAVLDLARSRFGLDLDTEVRFWECPFKILVDTREQQPYAFSGILANAEDGGGFVRVETVRFGLPEGDYGLEHDPRIRIERKSKADLWSTVAQGRDRFEAELARLQEHREWSAVVVEAEWSEVMDQPGFCQLNPRSLNRSILAWEQRFKSVHWIFRPGREVAEATVFWLLDRWRRDHI